MKCTWVLNQAVGLAGFSFAWVLIHEKSICCNCLTEFLMIDVELGSLDVDLTLQLTAQPPLPKAMSSCTELSCTPDTPLRKEVAMRSSEKTSLIHIAIHVRNNYNFFEIPYKMSGQIKFSLTLSYHRYSLTAITWLYLLYFNYYYMINHTYSWIAASYSYLIVRNPSLLM